MMCALNRMRHLAHAAKKLGMETLDKLKDEIRKGLRAEHEAETNYDLRRQAVDYLLAHVHFDLPDSLVAQETRSIVYDVVRDNTARGATKEQLEQKKDEILGYASKSAQERLRVSFILDAIAQAETIAVTPAELDARIVSMAERYRMTPEKLRPQLEEKGALGEIEEQILVGKTLDFLIASANVPPTKS